MDLNGMWTMSVDGERCGEKKRIILEGTDCAKVTMSPSLEN